MGKAKPTEEKPKPVIKKEIETFTYIDDATGETITFDCRRPSVSTYSKALKYLVPIDGSDPDMIKCGEVVLRDGFCGGDQRVLTDTEFIVGATMACFSLINLKVFDLKKN